MKKQYRSPLMASIHETAEGLHAAGVMDKRTMREFDELCLTPVKPLKPKEIRALRLRDRLARQCLPAISTSPPAWSASGSGANGTPRALRSSCLHL